MPDTDESVERSRREAAERDRTMQAAGAMLSLVARHPGFVAIRRSAAGVFAVGVKVSVLARDAQWFCDRNLLVALQDAAAAIHEHATRPVVTP